MTTITLPWPLRLVETLPAIGAEIIELPAPGLAPSRVALLYDADCDFRLREAAAVLYRAGLLPLAWAVGESKGLLRIAPRQAAVPWPSGVDVDGDHWGVDVVGEIEQGFGIQRIPDGWLSRDEAAALLKRMYHI